MDRFDPVEYRAARTMGEVDYFFQHQKRIPAARLPVPPIGILPRVRKVLDAIFLKKEGL